MTHSLRDFSSSDKLGLHGGEDAGECAARTNIERGLGRQWEAALTAGEAAATEQGGTEGLRDDGGTGGSGGRERQGGEGAGLGEEGGPASTGTEHWDVAELGLQSYQPISWGPCC